MKRLTTNKPDGNFETMLNYVYGKDGWACIRSDGEHDDVPLTDWAKAQCAMRECDELPTETYQLIDEAICDCLMDCPDCPVALAYCFACQAVHLRNRLIMYEDILFAEDGTELVSLEQLRTMASQLSNPPLTLDELREMDGEPVYLSFGTGFGEWAIVLKRPGPGSDVLLLRKCGISSPDCVDEWHGNIYRRKPEVSR